MGGGAGFKLDELTSLKALDFGCGIGLQSLMMSEFGIKAYGIDISSNAINLAKNLAESKKLNAEFICYDGENLPFSPLFFDFTISEGVIDSMPFSLAKKLVKQIDRVTKTYFFLSLISTESTSSFEKTSFESSGAGKSNSFVESSGAKNDFREFSGEIEVQDSHEFGTIQSFFNMDKINELMQGTSFKLKWGEKHQALNLLNNTTNSRYYLVFSKS